MIKFLKIESLILIESMEISFVDGFNVLSGETGSGKSAITEGLKILFGYKADLTAVRHGSEKAIVEAILDISSRQDSSELLQESGIELSRDEDLIIRREISKNGKNRAFINHHPVQVSLLKKLGTLLFNLVGQHANQQLFSTDEHRKILDDFAGHSEDVQRFAANWKEEQTITTTLHEWELSEAKRLREIETCKMEITEFQDANIREGEEEELFEEYSLLSSSEERHQKAGEVLQFLTSDKLQQFRKQKHALEQLAKQDPKTADFLQGFSQGLCELEEVSHQLRSYISKLNADPSRLQIIAERLSLINKMQKKYGPSFSEMQAYFIERQKQLNLLENSETHIEELKEKLQMLRHSNQSLMETISTKRCEAAIQLQKCITNELQSLNMAKAEFSIIVEKREPRSHGQEHVEFYLMPNAGEKAMPIRDGASGGELARVLLAIKTVMAGKELRSILIFDEVDANIGGATASIIGEKLKDLGKSHQIICITHFAQVAKFADHHLRIYKTEKEARTLTFVELLTPASQLQELARMHGKSLTL